MTREFISSQLFRPLETSKPNGSGIGAYQALKTIREMEGQLEVESHPGLGTTMRVRLARAKPSENEEKGALKHANSLNG
jgi:nitrogen-specific signal transduction histidine kinase